MRTALAFLLMMIVRLSSPAQADPHIGNAWPYDFTTTNSDWKETRLAFRWDLHGHVWEPITDVQTDDIWGHRYGFYAIRLTVGTGVDGTPRAFVGDVDGDGPDFTKFGQTWFPDVGSSSSLTETGDAYVLNAGSPGNLSFGGGWVYEFDKNTAGVRGGLVRAAEPTGREFTLAYDQLNGSVAISDPSGQHPIQLLFEGGLAPNVGILVGRPPVSPTSAFLHLTPETSPSPHVTGSYWGSDFYGTPSIEAHQRLTFPDNLLGIPSSMSVTDEQWWTIGATYMPEPSLPNVSSASSAIGALQAQEVDYTFSTNPQPDFTPDFQAVYRTGGVETHSLNWWQHQDGTYRFLTRDRGTLYNGCTGQVKIDMQLDLATLPTSVEVNTESGAHTATIHRTAYGNVDSYVDFNAKTWAASWFLHGGEEVPVLIQDPTGFTTTLDYGGARFNGTGSNPDARCTSIATLFGDAWRINYTDDGRLTEVWRPGAQVPARIEYYASGPDAWRVSRVTDDAGRVKDVASYTDLGLPRSTRLYPLDDPSTPGTIEGGVQAGITTSLDFNLLGDATRLTHSDGNHIDLSYAEGLATGLTDERGRTFLVDRNPAGAENTGLLHRIRAPSTTWEGTYYPERTLVEYSYDPNGNVDAILAGNGVGDTFVYGLLEEPKFDQFPSWDGAAAVTRTQEYRYGPDGTIREIVRPDGNTLHYEYDPNGNLLDVFGAGVRREYSYDDAGRLLESRVVNNGQVIRNVAYAYNTQTDRLITITYTFGPLAYSLHYLHNQDGTVQQEDLVAGGTTVIQRLNFAYDGSGTLVSITDNTPGYPSELTEFEYDGAGRHTGTKLVGDALETEYVYGDTGSNGHNFLKQVTHYKVNQNPGLSLSGGAPIARYTYSPYPDNTPQGVSETVGTNTTTAAWAYDPVSQVRSETRGSTTTFSYDSGGNITNWGNRLFTTYPGTNLVCYPNIETR